MEILKSRPRTDVRLASLLWLETPDENAPRELESYETISGSADDFESEALPSVEIEARELLSLAKSGSIPFEEIVRLVAVPDETVATLRRVESLAVIQDRDLAKSGSSPFCIALVCGKSESINQLESP